jgi:hypothetical protein
VLQREDTRNTLFRTPARNISFAQEENFNPVKRVAPNPNNLSIGPPTCLVSNIGEPFAGDPFCASGLGNAFIFTKEFTIGLDLLAAADLLRKFQMNRRRGTWRLYILRMGTEIELVTARFRHSPVSSA